MVKRAHGASKKHSIIAALTRGDLVVMPTDTVFGICADARNRNAVERVYRARKRNPKKPCIILIAHTKDVGLFGVSLTSQQQRVLKRVWPGPVTVVLDAPHKRFTYLHRGTRTLAFRMPGDAPLRALLLRTGPVIAPSANPEGFPTATSAISARRYFGDAVQVYISGRPRSRVPSGILDLTSTAPKILREHPQLKDFRIAVKGHTIAKWTKQSKNKRSSFTKRSKEKSRLHQKRGK